MRDVTLRKLDQLEIPDWDIRHAAFALADIVDNPDQPAHAAIAGQALATMLEWLHAAYQPRTPLEELLNAERAERTIARMRAAGGIPDDEYPCPDPRDATGPDSTGSTSRHPERTQDLLPVVSCRGRCTSACWRCLRDCREPRVLRGASRSMSLGTGTLQGMDLRERENAALFALLRARPGNVSWARLASEVAFEGSAQTVLRQLDSDALFGLLDERQLEEAGAIIDSWRVQGLNFVTVLDADYPVQLLDIRETPPFLFYAGKLRGVDHGMSVVGSRRASGWALDLAAQVARLLVAEDLTVIAGLAAGIDTAAHLAALEVNGRTVAFIGTGITQVYPKGNAELQQMIGRRGLVLSQFYPDASPTKFSFPMRNASMSGYGLATIIIEAGETSGTRIQARLAREHGRPVILTSKVAETTSWGEAIAAESGVYVASTMREMREAVHAVLEAPRILDSALAAMAAL